MFKSNYPDKAIFFQGMSNDIKSNKHTLYLLDVN